MWAEYLEKSKYVFLRRETNLNHPRWAEWQPYGSRRRRWVEEYTVFSTKAFFSWTILTMLSLVRTQDLDLPQKSQGLKNSFQVFPPVFFKNLTYLVWVPLALVMRPLCLASAFLPSPFSLMLWLDSAWFELAWASGDHLSKSLSDYPAGKWAQNPEPRPRIVPEILAYLRRR